MKTLPDAIPQPPLTRSPASSLQWLQLSGVVLRPLQARLPPAQDRDFFLRILGFFTGRR